MSSGTFSERKVLMNGKNILENNENLEAQENCMIPKAADMAR